jgi:hypothetical protein
MSLTRKLFYFCAVLFVFNCLASLPHPQEGELNFVRRVVLLKIDTDSSEFMDMAWAVVGSGRPLYQTLFFQQHLKFIYPASSLLTYAIAEKLHVSGARLIEWMIVLSLPATLAVVGEIFLLLSPPGLAERRDRLYRRLLVAALGLLFYPLVLGTYVGQIQTFMTFLWALAVYFWLKERKAAAGISLALVCVFKPMLAVFFVWGILRRQWRFVAAFAITAAAIQALTIAVFGWRNEVDYLAVLNYISHHGENLIENQSVNGLLQRLLHNGSMVWSRVQYAPFNRTVYLGTMLSSLVLFGFGLIYPLFRRWKSSARDFILFGMISTIATPVAWEHHYSYFFVASMYVLAINLRTLSKVVYLFAACFLVMANSWGFLDWLAATPLSLLLSCYLFAGVTMILIVAFATPPSSDPRFVADAASGLPTGLPTVQEQRLADLHQLRGIVR